MGLYAAQLLNSMRELRKTIGGVSFDITSPFQRMRRHKELSALKPRQKQLEKELSEFCGTHIELVSVRAKRSYDEIYFAMRDGRKFAVVRVNNPHKQRPAPDNPSDQAVPLPARERLDHEWNAYQRLSPAGLSPSPIWRTDDAIACSWSDWPRASQVLIRDRNEFWPMMESVVPAISRMHGYGVTHLDLNLGNMLVEPGTRKVAFIDFEFGPVATFSVAQQRAFDYLRLIDECTRTRRGGKQMLGNVDRLISLLHEFVDDETRDAELSLSSDKLKRLSAQSELCRKLPTVFTHLIPNRDP